MPPKYEQRETEQQWEERRLARVSDDRGTQGRHHSSNRRDSDRQQQENPDGGINSRRDRQQRDENSKERGDTLAAAAASEIRNRYKGRLAVAETGDRLSVCCRPMPGVLCSLRRSARSSILCAARFLS